MYINKTNDDKDEKRWFWIFIGTFSTQKNMQLVLDKTKQAKKIKESWIKIFEKCVGNKESHGKNT